LSLATDLAGRFFMSVFFTASRRIQLSAQIRTT